MENTPTPNSDFENYLRKHLQQIDAAPDDDVWGQIAGKQAQPNRWMKFRRYGFYAAGAVLLISTAIAVLVRQSNPGNSESAKEQQEQLQPALTDSVVMVNAEQSTLPNAAVTGISGSESNGKHAIVPNFGARANAVPATTIRFNTGSGLRYQSPVTGTSISIPANSLVDANGQPVSGDAELFFREYRTIEEFLASGIPMHYGDDRGSFFFNSGGMFEVRVSQAGETLQMGAGKEYSVNFSPTNELEKASLYYLEDQTGEWKFQPDAAFGQANITEPPVVTAETAAKNNLKNAAADCGPQLGYLADEPEPVELLQIGIQTGYDLATGKLAMPTWFRKNPTLTDKQLLFRMERGLVQIKKHHDLSQLFFPEDLNKYFTELAAFKGCYFTYNVDSLGGSGSVGQLTAGDYWQRITVAPENGANCVITLFDGNDGQMQFHATLTGSTENKKFKPEQVFAEYDRLRKQRQEDFARKNQALRYFLYSAPAFQDKQEWCFSQPDWLEFFEKNHSKMEKRYSDLIKAGLTTNPQIAREAWRKWQSVLLDERFKADERRKPGLASSNNLQYSLRLSKFGVYNCDQIFRFAGEQGLQLVSIQYKTPEGKKIIPASVSLMERRTRMFMSMPSAVQMVYSPERKFDIIVTDRDGRQYHFSREQYAEQKFVKNGVNSLTVNDVTEKTQSPRGWAELLEI